jgi:hypothetical protein
MKHDASRYGKHAYTYTQQDATLLDTIGVEVNASPRRLANSTVSIEKRMWNNFAKSLDLLRSLVDYLVEELALYEQGPNTCVIPVDEREAAVVAKLLEARKLISEVVHGYTGNQVRGFFVPEEDTGEDTTHH